MPSSLMVESSSEPESYDSEEDDEYSVRQKLHHDIFGDKIQKPYCAVCAGKHIEEECPNKYMNRTYS